MHLFKTIGKLSRGIVGPFFDQYARDRYGSKTIVCAVTGNDGWLELSFDGFKSVPGSVAAKHHGSLRSLCGQHALLRYGIPKPQEHPPIIVLLPMPSVISTLGPVEFMRFLKEWPGESKVGSLTVVEYIVMGAKHV